jgi:hypothetical protein
MAYVKWYTISFTNQVTENITIDILRKDIEPDEVRKLTCTFCNKKSINGQGDKFDTIIGSELNFGIFININDPTDFDDILVSFTDEWKIVLKNDGQTDFIGFLVPNECQASFRDKPYEIELTATDGLGYLRTELLSDINGTNFTGTNFLKSYIAGSLKKTLLDLDIRIYCNIYEGSFIDRHVNAASDMFNNAKLDYRTFLNTPIEFVKCYDALLLLLKEGFSLFQWYGKWVIMRIGELQYSKGPLIWYTDYDSNGNVIVGQLEDFGPAKIGKQQVLHPKDANQTILSRFAIKSARTQFDYVNWPEIPLNSKFERGPVIETGSLPDGRTYKKSYIDGWTFGKFIANPSQRNQLPLLDNADPDTAFRYSVYNSFGVEENREIWLENDSAPQHRLLCCEPIPVKEFGRANIGLDFKFSSSGSGNLFYLTVFLIIPGTNTKYTLANTDDSTFYWQLAGGWNYIRHNYPSGTNFNEWTNLSVKIPSIPANGLLCFGLMNYDSTNTIAYFKNISFEYFPYIAGSSQQVTGDYWFTSQNTEYKDIIEETIGISDSPERIFKGALLAADGVTPTGRSWHRLDILENKEYKELINMGRYNSAYRRTWQISGTFGGTMYHAADDQSIRLPIGFHKQFFFPDSIKMEGYYFQLVPPFSIDYVNGQIDATLVDCMKVDDNGNSIDGNQLGDVHEFKYLFKNA